MTDVPTLDRAPVDVTFLRQRVRDLPPEQLTAALAEWQHWGLPSLADEHGDNALVGPEFYGQIESLVAKHESNVDAERVRSWLRSRIKSMPDGPRVAVTRRLESLIPTDYFLPDGGAATGPTVGRNNLIEAVLAQVESTASNDVAQLLGAVQDGQIIAEPVADAAELADAIDWSKLGVADCIKTVDGDPGRARAALAAERRRNRPRAGVLSKLEPLVGSEAGSASPASAPPAAESSGEVAGTLVEAPSSAGSGWVGSIPASDAAISPVLAPLAQAEGVGAVPCSEPTPSVVPPVAPEIKCCTTEAGAGVTITSGPAPALPEQPWPPLKFAAMLGRLGSEMVTLARQIELACAKVTAEAKDDAA